ncbi:glycosyltransferase involved in cell wall biosynthesis [Anaeroplasma bactoclasticum]|uniref:Glycosyltransferase involved in cell wall biosynthesis n=1 Tax=Anaeroplasma bactoclasticum TaxID=2088 RepID=A0A397RXF9_9MOLU|nr:glycosyltransferase [Anaeroplasma bactoclasticum]RIA78408.1 glycosyltransferase involved in cell wall biosynthesis [Anaeroplasma bactoclasticum]
MEKCLDFKKKIKYFMESIYFGVLISTITLVIFMFDIPIVGYLSFTIIGLLMLIFDADFRNIIPLLFLYFGCWNYNQITIPSIEFYILLSLLIIDGLLFLVRFITRFKKYISNLKRDYLFYSLIVILAAMFISLINTPNMTMSMTGIGYQATITLAYFAVRVTVPKTEDAKKTIIESIIITGIMISLEASYLLFYRLQSGMDISTIINWKKLSFGWAHSNHYTAILNLGILLSMYYFIKYSKIKNRIFAILAILFFMGINIITVCRAGYIALIPTVLLSLLVYFLYNKRFKHNRIKKDLYYLIPFVLLAIVGVFILYKTGLIQEFTSHMKEMGFDGNHRDDVFKTSWDQFLVHPIIGSGVYTAKYYIPAGYGFWNYHNYILQMLGTCGIIGLISFLIYLFFSIKRTCSKDLYSAFVGIIILYFLIHGLMDTLYFNHLIMTLICVLQAVQVSKREEGNQEMEKLIINGKFLTQRVTGVQRVAYEMLKELDKDIKEGMVIIACPKNTEKIPEYKNIKVVKVGKLKGNLWEQISFPRFVKKEKGVALSLCNSAPLRNTGYITIHDAKVKRHPEYYSKKFVLWYNFMFKRILKRSIHIFTNSIFSRDEISECYKIDKNKFTIGYLGWQHYNSLSYDENTLSKYNLEKNKYFFAMGSMDPTKNFKWIAENAKNNPNYTFAIAGSINNSVFSDKMGFDCPSNVKLLGFVSDSEAKTLMRDSIAFLFPSHYEGFGIPPLEAMASGAKKIITSDIPIMHELFEGYVTFIDPLKYDYDFNTLNVEEKDFTSVLNKFSWKATEEAFYNEIFK